MYQIHAVLLWCGTPRYEARVSCATQPGDGVATTRDLESDLHDSPCAIATLRGAHGRPGRDRRPGLVAPGENNEAAMERLQSEACPLARTGSGLRAVIRPGSAMPRRPVLGWMRLGETPDHCLADPRAHMGAVHGSGLAAARPLERRFGRSRGWPVTGARSVTCASPGTRLPSARSSPPSSRRSQSPTLEPRHRSGDLYSRGEDVRASAASCAWSVRGAAARTPVRESRGWPVTGARELCSIAREARLPGGHALGAGHRHPPSRFRASLLAHGFSKH
jgi:hypothetical protein